MSRVDDAWQQGWADGFRHGQSLADGTATDPVTIIPSTPEHLQGTAGRIGERVGAVTAWAAIAVGVVLSVLIAAAAVLATLRLLAFLAGGIA